MLDAAQGSQEPTETSQGSPTDQSAPILKNNNTPLNMIKQILILNMMKQCKPRGQTPSHFLTQNASGSDPIHLSRKPTHGSTVSFLKAVVDSLIKKNNSWRELCTSLLT